jgi:hypothetical protein
MIRSTGSPAPRQTGRNVLTTKRPEILSALASAGIPEDSKEAHAAQLWAAAILRARDAWADRCRGGRRYQEQYDEPRQLNRLGGRHG